MGPTTSKSPQLPSLPIELIHYVLEVSLQPDGRRLESQRAWIACVALVSKSVNRIATPKLYDVIQLRKSWTVVLLAATLVSRRDLAYGVRGLHIAAARPNRPEPMHRIGLGLHPLPNGDGLAPCVQAFHVGEFIDERLAKMWSSCERLIVICKNAFLQVTNGVFDSNGILARPIPELQAPYRYLSIACTMGGCLPLATQLRRTTHLHFGMGKSAPGWVMLFSVIALTKEWDRLPSAAITHVAFDWDPESSCCGNLILTVKYLLDKAPNTLQRVTIRFPVFSVESKPAHIVRRWQVELCRTLSAIDDSRVFLSFVEVKSWRAEDKMYEMSLEGWRRHAQGLEDLWMSGHPVHSV